VTRLENILCAIDFSETSIRALGYAVAFARAFAARLTVVHVTPALEDALEPAGRGSGSEGRRSRTADEEVIAEIGRAIERAGAADLAPRPLAQEGRPAAAIVRCAAETGADLLVVGTHGRGGFHRLLLGSVTEKVVRTAGCPVLTIPPGAPEKPAAVFRNILCPIDFSPSSLEALELALELAGKSGGRVTALHTVEYIEVGTHDYFKQVIGQLEERLHAFVTALPRRGCTVEEVVTVNRAYQEILQRAAASGADLIVMGAQGHGGVELMLYGSNTHHVVRAATCPVLTVRS
jgi:nucleotide-binding universal stress UspA family protein